jgi:hypothetical protein
VSERTQERLHVDQAPSRCPFCHGPFDSLRDLVACAACGARHHVDCHAQNRKCATCGSSEVLVHPSRAQAQSVPEDAAPRGESRGSPFATSTLTPGEAAIVIGLVIPLFILGSVIDKLFFPSNSPHDKTGGAVIAAIVMIVPIVTIFGRRYRRWRRSRGG